MYFFFQAEDGIRDIGVTGVQTCALPIWMGSVSTTTSVLIPTTTGISAKGAPPLITGFCGGAWSVQLGPASAPIDRKSSVLGKSVDLGGRSIIKKNKYIVFIY